MTNKRSIFLRSLLMAGLLWMQCTWPIVIVVIILFVSGIGITYPHIVWVAWRWLFAFFFVIHLISSSCSAGSFTRSDAMSNFFSYIYNQNALKRCGLICNKFENINMRTQLVNAWSEWVERVHFQTLLFHRMKCKQTIPWAAKTEVLNFDVVRSSHTYDNNNSQQPVNLVN